MYLDNFYKEQFEEYYKCPEKYCNICYDIHNSETVELLCKHKYHYECIKNSYKSTRSRVCPYCRRDGGYLPLKESEKHIRGIHQEYVSVNNKSKQCLGILQSGKNKDQRCKNKVSHKLASGEISNYCLKHFHQLLIKEKKA